MAKKDLLNLLNEVKEDGKQTVEGDRFLLIDGLNLFFRNFSILNMVNPDGAHIGGLGGFFRSLGALIREINPTKVYVVFDGQGSSNNRKNILPEYKSDRNLSRITNWEAFDNLEEEDESKVEQIIRIIQYLQCLPVKIISIDKVEADDIIAYLSQKLPNTPKDKSIIVSSDKDYLQLVSQQIIVYRPIEKAYYTPDKVKSKFNILSENFIIYKTLMGDNSDSIRGIKGLGEKKLFKLFPHLSTEKTTFEETLNYCEDRLKEHVIYARILQEEDRLRKSYKLMDLSLPMIDDNDKEFIDSFIKEEFPPLHAQEFLQLYNQDQLGGIIRNVDFWIKDVFERFVK